MNDSALRGFHEGRKARWSVAGGEIADYGHPDREYLALTRTAALLDLSARGRLVLLGADRLKFLNGQVTNLVKDLREGEGCYAALVTAKAKMVSDLHVHALANEVLLDFEPGYTAAVMARLEPFILSDDVQMVDAAPHYGLLHVAGPRAEEAVVRGLGGERIPSVELGSQALKHGEWGDFYVVRHARYGVPGWDLYFPVATIGVATESLLLDVVQVGGGLCGWGVGEVARVEAGIPRFGVDMDGTTMPPEAGIEARAISYSKGCYSGQEVIARIRTYGQVAKALRGLKLSGGGQALPPRGTKLGREGKEVGWITSAVTSPRVGGRIALGYVRRECNQPGDVLSVVVEGGGMTAEVVPLPFVGLMLA
ncbi:MAG: aminomethyl transferase family protein [Verrucomicrobiales bacterium]|nr:aminomethyl transferase family protein [Verrucomicrobiales bacterium]